VFDADGQVLALVQDTGSESGAVAKPLVVLHPAS
jgi:hypothetical protein